MQHAFWSAVTFKPSNSTRFVRCSPTTGVIIFPSWLPEQLEPAVARLARVDDCIFEMGDLSGQWSLAGLEVKQVRRGDGRFRALVSVVRPIPPLISLLFSEVISHLRAVLDNVVWHLVSEQGALDDKAAKAVAMPIYDDPERFAGWAKDVRRRVPVLGQESSTINQRIMELQPFADHARVPSLGPLLARLTGMMSEDVHPLLLLQAYSNADKHRAITMMVGRAMLTTSGTPFLAQDRSLRRVGVGTVLGEGNWGTPMEFESSAAVVVERSAPWSAAVSPTTEAQHLRDWVAQRALPLLITGDADVTTAVPVTVSLGDDGRTLHDRIEAPDRLGALDRLAAVNAERYSHAMSQPPSFPETVIEEFDD